MRLRRWLAEEAGHFHENVKPCPKPLFGFATCVLEDRNFAFARFGERFAHDGGWERHLLRLSLHLGSSLPLNVRTAGAGPNLWPLFAKAMDSAASDGVQHDFRVFLEGLHVAGDLIPWTMAQQILDVASF